MSGGGSARRVVYSMSASLDGYVAGPDGDFNWTAPDEELFRVHNDRVRATTTQLLGRRLYETMASWETDDPGWAPVHAEFARIWRAIPKIVFSTTLTSVVGNARLARGDVAEEVARLKAQPGGDIAVGGAALGGTCLRLGLVDDVHLFVHPVVVGGGTPFFPPLEEPIALELAETRTFATQVVLLRYTRA